VSALRQLGIDNVVTRHIVVGDTAGNGPIPDTISEMESCRYATGESASPGFFARARHVNLDARPGVSCFVVNEQDKLFVDFFMEEALRQGVTVDALRLRVILGAESLSASGHRKVDAVGRGAPVSEFGVCVVTVDVGGVRTTTLELCEGFGDDMPIDEVRAHVAAEAATGLRPAFVALLRASVYERYDVRRLLFAVFDMSHAHNIISAWEVVPNALTGPTGHLGAGYNRSLSMSGPFQRPFFPHTDAGGDSSESRLGGERGLAAAHPSATPGALVLSPLATVWGVGVALQRARRGSLSSVQGEAAAAADAVAAALLCALVSGTPSTTTSSLTVRGTASRTSTTSSASSRSSVCCLRRCRR
jgi:hypothetical protein